MIRANRNHLPVIALSHAGRSGKENEDRYSVASYGGPSDKPVLFVVVSDGIGGHRAGEIAAGLTTERIVEHVSESLGTDPLAIMDAAIQAASQAIASNSASDADRAGMGATCACVWIDGNRLYTAHVGDSRIYLIRDRAIHRLTVDHTWIQEALEKNIITPEQAHGHPNAHVLRRHLGSVELPEVDLRLHLKPDDDDEQARRNQGSHLRPADILLICTDGLTDQVRDDEILRMLTTRNTLKAAAEDLVALANERGGLDNVTVVLVGVPKAGAAQSQKKGGWMRHLFGA
jgi:protein phosphatase